MLIGSCRTRGSLAARVLLACGQDPVEVCARAEARAAQLASGARDEGQQLAFTPLAKKVLEFALEEASNASHKWIGTHHFLLGLLRSNGTAAEGLASGGLKLLDARKAAWEVHEAATPPSERPLQSQTMRGQAQILREARDVCIALQEFDVASTLRDLIHKLEHPR